MLRLIGSGTMRSISLLDWRLLDVARWGMLGFVFTFPIESAGIEAVLQRAGYENNNHL